MKEIKIKVIQILDISNSLKFWNSWSKHKVNVTFSVTFLLFSFEMLFSYPMYTGFKQLHCGSA